jgi:hypothetical protein
MDESGNGNPDQPLIVGAVVADTAALDIETEVRRLYRELSARRSLRGHPGFERFRRSGFHASTDPLEISQPFIELIQRSVGFKVSLMATTQRSPYTHRGLTETQVISEMYETIVADNLLRYRDESALLVCIEENDSLRRMLPTLPRYSNYRAIQKLGIAEDLPEVRVEMVKKGSIVALAIADYVMLAVSRWIKSGFSKDPLDRAYRGFRAVAPAVSMLYSLDDGKLVDRKTVFE